MADKVTTMVIKVDLQCRSCYKKIKKLLCKFPEIRDQIYDDKQNTVTIAVVSCCATRIRDKLCCKGGKVIKSIEIKPPPKPKEPEKKPKEPEKKEKEKEKEKSKEPEEKKKESDGKADKPTSDQKPPKEVPSTPKPPELATGAPFPMSGYPTFYPSGGPCFGPCCNGYGYCEGPCSQAYGRPVPWYDNYGYGPYGFCGNMNRYVSPHEYFSQENVSTCTIM